MYYSDFSNSRDHNSSSGADLFLERIPQLMHWYRMTQPFLLFESMPIGFSSPWHCDILSPGPSLSTCFEKRHTGQWFLYEPFSSGRTCAPQFSQTKCSSLAIKTMGLS